MARRAFRFIAPAVLLLLAAALALPAAAQTFAEADAAYERGDYATAYRGFRRLAEQGNAAAQFNLGRMYDKGQSVAKDYAEAAKWYRRAAEQGHARAQYNLGIMYADGQGVPKDYAEALKWYRRAAEQGEAYAQNNLGTMYEHGKGVQQDYAEAAKWYRRAAKQGEAYAQNNLGVMYDNGQGVPQDYAAAVKWYRRAAEQGDAYAQYNLGIMYKDGKGVRRDSVQAHKWFNLAASRVAASDKELREDAVASRDRVAEWLTDSQLAQAHRLARVWRPGTGAAAPTPPAVGRDNRRRVAAVQRALAQLGYDPGAADGVAGRKTRNAVRAFQAAAGLPVDGRVSGRLERAVLAALRRAGPAPRPALEKASTGSGFRISAGGDILTNAHVVRGCAEVRLPSAGGAPSHRVPVAARDDAAGLALLNGPAASAFRPTGSPSAIARYGSATVPSAAFRRGRGVRPGARVVVAGYPLRGILAAGLNVSAGNVSALAGPGNDRRLIQITAPVQPGNSGGPVLDSAGNVVGVVVSKLNALKVARATGDIPQNVNFAVSAGTARAFLDAEGVAYRTASSGKSRAPEDVAAAARMFTVLVECWK